MNEQLPSLNLIKQPNKQFKEDFDVFLQTDSSTLKNIFCSLDFHWTKNRINEEESLSKKLSLDPEKVNTILSIGSYIFSKLERGEITLDAINDDLKKLGYDKTTFTKIKDAYETYGLEVAKKLDLRKTYLEQIFTGENLLGSLIAKINYRVINDENQKILDLVPIVDFCISTTPFEPDIQSETQKIEFQASEEQINDLIKTLNETKTELLVASEYLKPIFVRLKTISISVEQPM